MSDAVSEPAVFVLPADSAPEHTGAVLQGPGRPEEQQPYLRDPAVRQGPTVWPSTTWGIMGWPGTDVCLGRLGGTGQPQGLSCCFPFSFSLLWALVSFLLPPLKISVYEHSPRKEGGTQRHLPAPLSPPSPCSPRCGGPLHGTRWNPSSLSSSSLGPGAGGWTA